MPNLFIENVRVTVPDGAGRRELLRIDDFFLPAGALLGLKGASGAGKSTFLKLVSGILAPERGGVRWDDVHLGGLDAPSRDRWRGQNVGFLFQDFRLFDELSALENVLLPATFRLDDVKRARTRALEALDRLGVRHDTPAKRLSRGEMQRCALARALLARPGILLADEPTASLDRANADAVMSLLAEAAREYSATLIVVTHDRDRLERFALKAEIVDGRLGLLDDGDVA